MELTIQLLLNLLEQVAIEIHHHLERVFMAKITNYIPEPKEEYDVDNQRQIMESLNTMKQQLNFSFQQDLKNEQDTFNYFLS